MKRKHPKHFSKEIDCYTTIEYSEFYHDILTKQDGANYELKPNHENKIGVDLKINKTYFDTGGNEKEVIIDFIKALDDIKLYFEDLIKSKEPEPEKSQSSQENSTKEDDIER